MQEQKLQRCLDHVRQLTRSRKWKHKEGRGTSNSYWSRTHGPRGLLTTHPGGIHGNGWSPGGGSSVRQGAGTASPGSPDLETAVAAVQRGERERQIDIRGFLVEGKYRRRGHREGPQGSQEGAWRGLGWGRARDPSGVPVVAPLPSFCVSGGFWGADFLYNFSGIFGAL